jgi:hypothetical protein
MSPPGVEPAFLSGEWRVLVTVAIFRRTFLRNLTFVREPIPMLLRLNSQQANKLSN